MMDGYEKEQGCNVAFATYIKHLSDCASRMDLGPRKIESLWSVYYLFYPLLDVH